MNKVERYFFDGGVMEFDADFIKEGRLDRDHSDSENVTPFCLLSSLRGYTYEEHTLSVREAKTGDQQLDKRAIMRRLDAAIEASEYSDVEYWFARRLDLSPLTGHARVKLRAKYPF